MNDLAELRQALEAFFPGADAKEFADALGVVPLERFEFYDARDIVADTNLKVAPAR